MLGLDGLVRLKLPDFLYIFIYTFFTLMSAASDLWWRICPYVLYIFIQDVCEKTDY